ncbi:hypothetical protein DFH09DRAFT_1370078 [Mycena vulgaris]|nr:hypothetical protein DFH09DRAFT_1370078 [Mycena vulgaris]
MLLRQLQYLRAAKHRIDNQHNSFLPMNFLVALLASLLAVAAGITLPTSRPCPSPVAEELIPKRTDLLPHRINDSSGKECMRHWRCLSAVVYGDLVRVKI